MRARVIDPGMFRDELTVETVTRTIDDLGGYSEDWAASRTVFGLVEPVGARSEVRSERREAVLTHRVWLRNPSGIDGTMRLRKGARIFRVVTVSDPDGSGRYQVVTVVEEGA